MIELSEPNIIKAYDKSEIIKAFYAKQCPCSNPSMLRAIETQTLTTPRGLQ